MTMRFRLLKPCEINVKIKTVNKDSLKAMALLYKDARTDMTLLDETVGEENWQTSYATVDGTLYCTLSVWSDKRNQWIAKQSNGTESDMEAEKGEASDALKRAGFLWGIGRELYTSPSVSFKVSADELNEKRNGVKPFIRFHVSEVGYNEEKRCITLIKIADNRGEERFSWTSKEFPTTLNYTESHVASKPQPKAEAQKPTIAEPQKDGFRLPTDKVELVKMLEGLGCDVEKVLIAYKRKDIDDITVEELQQAYFRKSNAIKRGA